MATAATQHTVQVGDVVIYTGRDGIESPALVTITPESFDAGRAGDGITPPQPGEVSLVVWRASGRSYARHNVPAEGSPAHMAALDAADPGDGQVVRARCWHPRT
jgi:hypothetical protein